MLELLFILLRFLVPSAIVVCLFWCALVRFGPVDDLNTNSPFIKIVRWKREPQAASSSQQMQTKVYDPLVPTINADSTSPIYSDQTALLKRAMLLVLRQELESKTSTYPKIMERRSKENRVEGMLYPGFPDFNVEESFATESIFPAKSEWIQ